jgi:two-component system chemotaxis sensor kinase CheA
MDSQAVDPAGEPPEVQVDRAALLPVFVAEAEENLVALEEMLLGLEESPDDEEILATIFRAAHTLKGNAESIGFPAITACAHAVEGVLAKFRSGSLTVGSAIVSALLEANDALREMVQIAAGGGNPVLAEFEARIHALVSLGESGSGAATKASAASTHPGPTALPRGKTLRVDLATIDRIVTHLEELAISRARLEATLDRSGSGGNTADALADADRRFDELREQVMRLRLVPVGSVFRAQSRAVRDLAPAHGKRARLAFEGSDVEVDTNVLEALKGPITHMVRNAIDHGIEAPALRRASGKDPIGTITLRARHASGRLVIEVSDDGAGFHRERILARAYAMGILDGDGAALSDREIFALVFTAGFSTAEHVSELSGRGVGMDVVAHDVATLKGFVEVTSEEGKGTTVALSVPLTLSIVDGFAVVTEGEAYLIPLESVRECIQLPAGLSREGDGCGVLPVRGGALPYVRLRDLFALGGSAPVRENVVVVEHAGRKAGLVVDTLRGRTQAVVKPLASLLRGSDAVAGTTLLGDGRVALILDVPALLRDLERRQRMQPSGRHAAAEVA